MPVEIHRRVTMQSRGENSWWDSLGIFKPPGTAAHNTVHSIIAIAVARGPISRDQLVKELNEYKISRDPYGAIASLMTNAGNAFGRVFVEEAGRLVFHPDLRDEVQEHRWHLPVKPPM